MKKNLLNKKNILLGATLDNELVFANINIRENKEFSVSFALVTPTKIDNEYLYERFTSLIEELSKSELYDLCEQYDVAPSKLIDEMFYYANIEDILDISVFPEEVEVNKDNFVFETVSCGQCETRNLMSEYVDEESYYKLMTLWDNYHLKTIDDDTIQEVETIIEQLNEVDQMEFIQDYIIENNYR